MSTDPTKPGGKQLAEQLVAESHAALPVPAAAQDQRDFDFLDVPSPEEMSRARREIKEETGSADIDELDVLDRARAKRSKGGRRKNSRNKRTKDFERYILQNGNRDPALVLAEIASTPAEVLVQRSRDLDPIKKRLDYGGAQALRMRAAEGLMPYMHGKKPVEVQLTAEGDFNLIIPGENISHADARKAADGEFVLEGEYEEMEEEGDE